MLDHSFIPNQHPTLLVVAAIYHYESRGTSPYFSDVCDILNPLISRKKVKETLKELIHWGVVITNVRSAASKGAPYDWVQTYEIGPYSHGTARHTYERYWEDIIIEKLIISEHNV